MSSPLRGMTLIDVLVGSALVLIVFLGLFGILKLSLNVTSLAKLKATATALTTSRMEYVRSLPYESVGTVGGIPAGILPQNETVIDGGISFSVRTYVEYVDDARDGLAASDSNSITTDYKNVKIVTTYLGNGSTRDVTLISSVAPVGIETTTGGGTLQVTVVDAAGTSVSGASVRVVNSAVSPAVDVTTFSDVNGRVTFGGAATSTQYQVFVSKTGYSSAQTYARDSTNQNPTPGYLTVVRNQTTSSAFAIDVLANLTLRTFTPVRAAVFFDSFADSSKVSQGSSVAIGGGVVQLTGAPGTYAASGSVLSTTTAPAYLSSWTSASSTASRPVGTDVRVSVTDASGTLIPDAALAGNSTGFTGVINLSGLSTTTYPGLKLRATLSSSDVLQTPTLSDWELGYQEGPIPLTNIAFTLTGTKTIGTTGAGASIYKTIVSTTTDSAGARSLNLEWDLYTLAIPGRTIIESSPETPYELQPGSTLDARVILQP